MWEVSGLKTFYFNILLLGLAFLVLVSCSGTNLETPGSSVVLSGFVYYEGPGGAKIPLDSADVLLIPTKIAYKNLSTNAVQTKTDKNGKFVFEKVSPGNYTIKISKEGFNEHVQDVNISSSGMTEPLEFDLKAKFEVLHFSDDERFNRYQYSVHFHPRTVGLSMDEISSVNVISPNGSNTALENRENYFGKWWNTKFFENGQWKIRVQLKNGAWRENNLWLDNHNMPRRPKVTEPVAMEVVKTLTPTIRFEMDENIDKLYVRIGEANSPSNRDKWFLVENFGQGYFELPPNMLREGTTYRVMVYTTRLVNGVLYSSLSDPVYFLVSASGNTEFDLEARFAIVRFSESGYQYSVSFSPRSVGLSPNVVNRVVVVSPTGNIIELLYREQFGDYNRWWNTNSVENGQWVVKVELKDGRTLQGRFLVDQTYFVERPKVTFPQSGEILSTLTPKIRFQVDHVNVDTLYVRISEMSDSSSKTQWFPVENFSQGYFEVPSNVLRDGVNYRVEIYVERLVNNVYYSSLSDPVYFEIKLSQGE